MGGHTRGYNDEEFRRFHEYSRGNVVKMARESGRSLDATIARCRRLDLDPGNIPKDYKPEKKNEPTNWTEKWAPL